jgi:hypothetical protein
MHIIEIPCQFTYMPDVVVTMIGVTQVTTLVREKLVGPENPEPGQEIVSSAICSLYTAEGVKTGIPVIQNLALGINLSTIDADSVQRLMAGVAAEALAVVGEMEKQWTRQP